MGIIGVAEPLFKSLLIYPHQGSLILDPKKTINSVNSSQKLVSQCFPSPSFFYLPSFTWRFCCFLVLCVNVTFPRPGCRILFEGTFV